MDLRMVPYGVWDAHRRVMTLVDGSLGIAREAGLPAPPRQAGDLAARDGVDLVQETFTRRGDRGVHLFSWMTAPRRRDGFLSIVVRGEKRHGETLRRAYETRADALIASTGGLEGSADVELAMAPLGLVTGLDLAAGPGGDMRGVLGVESEDRLVPFAAEGALSEDIPGAWREVLRALGEGVTEAFGIGFAVDVAAARGWIAGLVEPGSRTRIAQLCADAGLVVGWEEGLRALGMLVSIPFGFIRAAREEFGSRSLEIRAGTPAREDGAKSGTGGEEAA